VKKHNFFERHSKKTVLILTVLIIFIFVGMSELVLQKFMGLGNPVLYDSSPIYGYRPLPNKEYRRFGGAKIKFNNLALRTESDWDDKRENKILFLGDSITYGGSYIDNSELFSSLVVKDFNGYESGNAGVNGWGVENIHGLVVESNFLPAQIYVTTLPEGDFYRGLTRLQGLPFFNNPPRLAFEELWLFFCCSQNNKRYRPWQDFSDEKQTILVVEKAVNKLRQMDMYLKEKGFEHLIFITPSLNQALEKKDESTLIQKMLLKHSLKFIPIKDELKKYDFSDNQIISFYNDNIHLTKEGHKIWSEIIRYKLAQLINL